MKKIKVNINFNVVTEDMVTDENYKTLLEDKKKAEEILAKQFKERFETAGELKVTFEVEEIDK